MEKKSVRISAEPEFAAETWWVTARAIAAAPSSTGPEGTWTRIDGPKAKGLPGAYRGPDGWHAFVTPPPTALLPLLNRTASEILVTELEADVIADWAAGLPGWAEGPEHAPEALLFREVAPEGIPGPPEPTRADLDAMATEILRQGQEDDDAEAAWLRRAEAELSAPSAEGPVATYIVISDRWGMPVEVTFHDLQEQARLFAGPADEPADLWEAIEDYDGRPVDVVMDDYGIVAVRADQYAPPDEEPVTRPSIDDLVLASLRSEQAEQAADPRVIAADDAYAEDLLRQAAEAEAEAEADDTQAYRAIDRDVETEITASSMAEALEMARRWAMGCVRSDIRSTISGDVVVVAPDGTRDNAAWRVHPQAPPCPQGSTHVWSPEEHWSTGRGAEAITQRRCVVCDVIHQRITDPVMGDTEEYIR